MISFLRASSFIDYIELVKGVNDLYEVHFIDLEPLYNLFFNCNTLNGSLWSCNHIDAIVIFSSCHSLFRVLLVSHHHGCTNFIIFVSMQNVYSVVFGDLHSDLCQSLSPVYIWLVPLDRIHQLYR